MKILEKEIHLLFKFKDPIELSYYEQAHFNQEIFMIIEWKKFEQFFANINASLIESKQTYGQVETNLRTLALRDGETLTGSRQLPFNHHI